MPLYTFYCASGKHAFEEAHSISKVPIRKKCGKCGRMARRGLSPLSDQFVRNRVMSSKTKRDFRYTFKRDEYRRMETTGDVDRALDGFHMRYPHLKRPDLMRNDRFSSVRISDGPENQRE